MVPALPCRHCCGYCGYLGHGIGVFHDPVHEASLHSGKCFPGTSGGVSAYGTFAGALGALVVTLTALPFTELLTISMMLLLILSAMAGSAIDSVLGATVQAQYQCRHCGLQTEKRVHCDDAATLLCGWPAVTNDAVNLLSTVSTLLLASIASLVLGL
jgi:uncharacterized membrane protein